MQIVLNGSTVLCNFDDVNPTFSGQAFSTVSTDHGYYGSGMALRGFRNQSSVGMGQHGYNSKGYK